MRVGELYYSAYKSKFRSDNLEKVDAFVRLAMVIDSDRDIMVQFGLLKSTLVKQGRILADADILIAATALIKCDKLVTGNEAHFTRFQDLRLENWIR